MRRTPHRRAVATGAVVAMAAMLTVSVQAGAGTAATPRPGQVHAQPDPGALPAKLTPAQRAELLRAARAGAAETARQLKLGPKEKLVVRDVVKDVSGSLHTRYERTYAGLPVLGGGLVVHKADGKVRGVTKAVRSQLDVPTTTAKVKPATAEQKALKASQAQGAEKSDAQEPRKVVWVADGKPLLAYETVVGGVQEDGTTPNELHVVTDATTGEKLAEWQGVHEGTGNSMYSGQVTLGTAPSYTLTDTTRGNHKTYNLN
ncbi:M4 family metallopeptidase, partial [Streptomyces rimosus]